MPLTGAAEVAAVAILAAVKPCATAYSGPAGGVGHPGLLQGEDRPVFHDLAHVALDDALALVVERRGRLVEDQDRRVGGERASDGEPLALAAGKVGAAFLDHRVVALRQPVDEFVGAGQVGDRHHLGPRHGREDSAMFSWIVRLKSRLSWSTTPMLVRSQGVDVGKIHIVQENLAFLRDVEALDKLGQRRFARARRPHDADTEPGLMLIETCLSTTGAPGR